VVKDGGLPAGTVLPGGVTLREPVPQAHKVALADIPAGAAVRRYDATIGYALTDIAAGSWVDERRLRMPAARSLQSVPAATPQLKRAAPLEGYTFEGFVNADGSVGTRNILAIAQTVQCTAGVAAYAVERIKQELLPQFPNVDDVVALGHTYGCGVAIEAPGSEIPIRTLRNITKNLNFGGNVLALSLGCEKLQPDRLWPRNATAIIQEEGLGPSPSRDTPHVVQLQNSAHVGFQSMIDAILIVARHHLDETQFAAT
jgi:galactarate dehydratase